MDNPGSPSLPAIRNDRPAGESGAVGWGLGGWRPGDRWPAAYSFPDFGRHMFRAAHLGLTRDVATSHDFSG